MLKKISIAIDAMGGDNSPDKTIEEFPLRSMQWAVIILQIKLLKA